MKITLVGLIHHEKVIFYVAKVPQHKSVAFERIERILEEEKVILHK